MAINSLISPVLTEYEGGCRNEHLDPGSYPGSVGLYDLDDVRKEGGYHETVQAVDPPSVVGT